MTIQPHLWRCVRPEQTELATRMTTTDRNDQVYLENLTVSTIAARRLPLADSLRDAAKACCPRVPRTAGLWQKRTVTTHRLSGSQGAVARAFSSRAASSARAWWWVLRDRTSRRRRSRGTVLSLSARRRAPMTIRPHLARRAARTNESRGTVLSLSARHRAPMTIRPHLGLRARR